MKVLLVSRSIRGGGAANACLRLYQALRASGTDVRLLVLDDANKDEWVQSIVSGQCDRMQRQAYFALERLQVLWQMRGRTEHLWRISTARFGFDISRHPWVSWADVIHLHWVNHGFVSLRAIHALTNLGKPIVWTLHDLWVTTGGCHLPILLHQDHLEICPRYERGCGKCPLLGSSRANDSTARNLRAKHILRHPSWHYIAVSRAEANQFERSALLGRAKPIAVIPPPLDLSLYEPSTSAPLPEWYDPSRHYLLVVAARIDDAVKGVELLRRATQALAQYAPEVSQRCVLLLAGQVRRESALDDFGIEVRPLGSVRGAEDMARLYRLADLTLSTSLLETFGQTLTEALASGCPVVSFRSGGPEDIIRPGENGYLVDAYDTTAFARAIVQALEDFPKGQDETRLRCQASIRHLSYASIAEQQIAYYKSILSPTHQQ